MTHNIKLKKEFCEAVLCGDKCFEVRENDRNYQRGDYVKFVALDSSGFATLHPLNKKIYIITYVLAGWGIKDNYVVFGIKEVETNADGNV